MKKILNVKEIKDYLSISESTIRKLIREKKIPYFRIFSKILLDKDEIDKWIDDKQTGNKLTS